MENGATKATLTTLERDAVRARWLGLALLTLGVTCMIAAALLSGYAAWRAKQQSVFNERLSRSIAEYQYDHAAQAQDSFKQLQDSLRCSNLAFAKVNTGLHALDPEAIAACFRPPPQAPPPRPETTEERP